MGSHIRGKMRRSLLALGLFLTLHGPAAAQPWLECAERYLPAVADEGTRMTYRESIVHHYARNGEFARAQSLISEQAGEQAASMGALAAIGALRGEHLDQALRWAEQYIPAREISWKESAHLAHGSLRERFLRSARSPRAARKVLEFLRAHGGVSIASLVFTLHQVGGMPHSVSDFYLRELAAVADQVGPFEWVRLVDTLEAAGEEFSPLRERALNAMLERSEALVAEIAELTATPPPRVDEAMRRYAAFLLARRGRFEQAEEVWLSAGQASPAEQQLYLQNQYLGGRQDQALAELARLVGMEEDARVRLSQFLQESGHYEEAKKLGTDPIDYLDMGIARRDLERGINIDRWLAFVAERDTRLKPVDSVLVGLAHNLDMPQEVRQKAQALLPDPAGSRALAQANLGQEIKEIEEAGPEQRSLLLLLLDSSIERAGVGPGPDGLQRIEKLAQIAPAANPPERK